MYFDETHKSSDYSQWHRQRSTKHITIQRHSQNFLSILYALGRIYLGYMVTHNYRGFYLFQLNLYTVSLEIEELRSSMKATSLLYNSRQITSPVCASISVSRRDTEYSLNSVCVYVSVGWVWVWSIKQGSSWYWWNFHQKSILFFILC